MELDKGRDRRGKKLLRDKKKEDRKRNPTKRKPRMDPYNRSDRKVKIYEDTD